MKTIIRFIILLVSTSLSFGQNDIIGSIENTQEAKIDTFTFLLDGIDLNGKIYLPGTFNKDKNLHAIYLIDFTEQHFKVAKDEFEKVINAVEEIQDFDAVVVTLEEHLDVDANTGDFQLYYDVYKNMTSYVDTNYTNNNSRTFIARGSEGGIVLMTLFLEDSASSVFENFVVTDSPSSFNSYIVNMINGDDFPKDKSNKKLHFSFSTSNNRSSCTSLINAINQAQYPWLQFESLEYTEIDYENAYPLAFAEGLKFIFSDIKTVLDENYSTATLEYQLDQNYPNPFNPNTTINYSLPKRSYVSLKVYNILGKEVLDLVNKELPKGNYKVELDATLLSSGVYLYSLTTNNFYGTKKMILMK